MNYVHGCCSHHQYQIGTKNTGSKDHELMWCTNNFYRLGIFRRRNVNKPIESNVYLSPSVADSWISDQQNIIFLESHPRIIYTKHFNQLSTIGQEEIWTKFPYWHKNITFVEDNPRIIHKTNQLSSFNGKYSSTMVVILNISRACKTKFLRTMNTTYHFN